MANLSSQHARFGSGKAVRRVEDEALLTGQGRFADDVNAAGEAHVAFLRSPHPHARIVAIDTAAAAAMPGVIAVVTGADLVRAGVKPLLLSADFRAPMARRRRRRRGMRSRLDVVRHVGEAVAAVVAESVAAGARRDRGHRRSLRAAADGRRGRRARLRRARRSSGPRPPATSRARCATATPKRPRRRFARPRTWCASTSSTSASRRARSSRARPSPRTTPATERLTLTVSCQTPTGLRDELGEAVLGIPKEKVRVLVGDVGGGFGMKTNLYPEDVVAGVLRAPIQASGQMVRRRAWTSFSRPRTAATSRARRSSRSTRTGASSRCASTRSPTSAPMPPAAAS